MIFAVECSNSCVLQDLLDPVRLVEPDEAAQIHQVLQQCNSTIGEVIRSEEYERDNLLCLAICATLNPVL